MRFFVVKCGCGRWRAISTNSLTDYTFKCFACNKSSKFKKKNELGLNYRAYETQDLTTAVNQVSKLNERENK